MSSYRIVTAFSRQLLSAPQRQQQQRLLNVAPAKRCETVRRLQSTTTPSATNAAKPKRTSTLKLAVLGTTLGALGGTVLSIYENSKDKSSHMEHETIPPKVIATMPDVKITKRFVNPNDKSGLEVVLFQFQTCPFCCKVRAFLDYMGISYSVVEVDAVLRQDLKWSESKKVPMVLVRRGDGRYVQMSDSSAIISLLASYLNNKENDVGELAKYYPVISYFDDNGKKKYDVMHKYFPMYLENTPKRVTSELQEKERKWRLWADNHLVHLISPNCYQTMSESLETFEWFSQAGEWSIHFPKWERDLMVYAGATAMWLIAKMLKKRHDLTDDVRSHIYTALDKWTRELQKQNTKFMGGKEPNMADLSVFGVLSSMEGCQAFTDCLNNTKIGDWFYSVKELVQKNRGTLVRERIEGEFPAEVAASLA